MVWCFIDEVKVGSNPVAVMRQRAVSGRAMSSRARVAQIKTDTGRTL